MQWNQLVQWNHLSKQILPWGRFLLIAIMASGLAGCAGLAQKLAQHMANESLRHDHDFKIIEGDSARYRQCLKTQGGSCPNGPGPLRHTGLSATPPEATASLSATAKSKLSQEPAGDPIHLAASALECETVGHATKLYSHLRALPTSQSQSFRVEHNNDGTASTIDMSMSVAGVQKCQNLIAQATAAGGWDRLEASLRTFRDRAEARSSEHRDLTADHRRAAFVKAYLDAYFSNGHFLTVDLRVDQTLATQKLTKELEKHPELCKAYNAAEGVTADDGSECAALAEKIYRGVLGATLGSDQPLYLIRAKPVGYHPRDGGTKLQFPEIDVDFDPVKRPMLSITYSDGSSSSDQFGSSFWLPVGTDLVRVVLDAVFDAHEGLPAVSGATGLTVPGYPLQPITGLENQNLLQNLDKMRQASQHAAVGVGVVLDREIRGIGPFTLNNEALEQLIVAVVTTSVQKAMEKAVWCFYSCDLNLAIDKAKTDLEQAAKEDEKRLTGDLKHYAYDQAEKVRLHVSLSE